MKKKDKPTSSPFGLPSSGIPVKKFWPGNDPNPYKPNGPGKPNTHGVRGPTVGRRSQRGR